MRLILQQDYRIREECGHSHYMKLRGLVVKYVRDYTDTLAEIWCGKHTWYVYKHDLLPVEVEHNEQAVHLLLHKESL
jgi:hypothetical protein